MRDICKFDRKFVQKERKFTKKQAIDKINDGVSSQKNLPKFTYTCFSA